MHWRSLARVTLAVLLAGAAGAQASAADAEARLPLEQRLLTLTQAYADVQTYFAHEAGLPPDFALDAAYREALQGALAGDDRHAFARVMARFLGALRNGHSWYYDPWDRETHGAPLGFGLRPLGDLWVVDASEVAGLRPGDVVTAVDGVPMETFFERMRPLVSASSERQARFKLGGQSWLWPSRFEVTLAGGRRVGIVRERPAQKPPPVESRMLSDGIAYVKVRTFGPGGEDAALEAVTRHRDARGLVIDVRGNGGGGTPSELVAALMDRPYRFWAEQTPATLGVFRFYGEFGEAQGVPALEAYRPFARASLAWPAERTAPAEAPVFSGPLVLLVDGLCVSACEDFVLPFKDNGRARIVGERTAVSTGQPHVRMLHGGAMVNVGTKRAFFPDGAPFEGVGIAPDEEVVPTREELRAGRDPVLARARAWLEAR